MKRYQVLLAFFFTAMSLLFLVPSPLVAGQALRVTWEGLDRFGHLPHRQAFCPAEPVQGPNNLSPALSWSRGPAGTQSYAILLTDPDVPADLSLIGKPEQDIPESAPRQPFHHWVLTDIPANRTSLQEGEDSPAMIIGGKPPGLVPHGVRGLNDYTRFTAADPKMAGLYGGYDGPCPPENDRRVHRYTIRVYALSVPHLTLPQPFDAATFLTEVAPFVLATGETVGLYTRRVR